MTFILKYIQFLKGYFNCTVVIFHILSALLYFRMSLKNAGISPTPNFWT